MGDVGLPVGWRSAAAASVPLAVEYIKIICGGHCNDMVVGVPGGVKDLAMEVQTVHGYLVLLLLTANINLKDSNTRIYA